MRLEVSVRETCIVLPLIGMSGGCGKIPAYPNVLLTTLNIITQVFSPRESVHPLKMTMCYCSVPSHYR